MERARLIASARKGVLVAFYRERKVRKRAWFDRPANRILLPRAHQNIVKTSLRQVHKS